MPPFAEAFPAPRVATPIPDPCGHSFLRSQNPSLRLMVATDGQLRIRHLVQKFRATGRLRPHLPDDPGFITPGVLRLLAKTAPVLLHADEECLLVHCVKHGLIECVRYLLALGSNPNAAFKVYDHHDSGYFRSSNAEDSDDKSNDTLQMLIDTFLQRFGRQQQQQQQQQPVQTNKNGVEFPNLNIESPVAVAVRYGRTECLQLLLDHGADLSRDPLGCLTLDAARLSHWGVLQLLLSRSAETSLKLPNYHSVIEYVIMADSSHEADLFNLFRMLVEWGGCSDLEMALLLSASLGNLRFIRYLIEFVGASVSQNTKFPNGITSVPVFEYLLQNKVFSKLPELRDLLADPAMRTISHVRILAKYGGGLIISAADRADEEAKILKDCAMHGLVDLMRYLVDEAKFDLYAHLRAIIGQALTFAQPSVMRFILERSSVPLSRLLRTNEEVLIRLTNGSGNSEMDLYVEIGEKGTCHIRGRANFGSLRVTEETFNRVLSLENFRLVRTIREIIRAKYRGETGSIMYWLEDTLLREEVIPRV